MHSRFASIALAAAVALASLAGCSDSDDSPPGGSTNTATASTGTTAYGVLGTPTARVAFVPAGKTVIPILLENSGTLTISSGRSAAAAAAAAVSPPLPVVPLSFVASACTVDSNDLKGVCIGYGTSMVAVLDLATFATSLRVADITVREFDSGAGTLPNSYSGGSCILCGVAADIGKRRFVVGGAGGFRVFEYGSLSTGAGVVYDIPVGENFAFLPQPGGDSYIIAPDYEPQAGNASCASSTSTAARPTPGRRTPTRWPTWGRKPTASSPARSMPRRWTSTRR